MSMDIDAVYENGVLRPDKPLPLAEHQRVSIHIEEQVAGIRRSAGLIPLPTSQDAIAYLLGPENQPWERG